MNYEIIFGLAYACPYLERQEDCPLKIVVHLSFKGKVLWIKELSNVEKEIILEHHRACSVKR